MRTAVTVRQSTTTTPYSVLASALALRTCSQDCSEASSQRKRSWPSVSFLLYTREMNERGMSHAFFCFFTCNLRVRVYTPSWKLEEPMLFAIFPVPDRASPFLSCVNCRTENHARDWEWDRARVLLPVRVNDRVTNLLYGIPPLPTILISFSIAERKSAASSKTEREIPLGEENACRSLQSPSGRSLPFFFQKSCKCSE